MTKKVGKGTYRKIEKRKFQRLEIPLAVRIHFPGDESSGTQGQQMTAASRDISPEGICIEIKNAVVDNSGLLPGLPGTQNRIVDLEIELTDGFQPFTVNGEVCWYDVARDCEEFMYQIGIVFVAPGHDQRKRLSHFLKKHRKRTPFYKKLFSSTCIILH